MRRAGCLKVRSALRYGWVAVPCLTEGIVAHVLDLGL